MIKIIPNKEKTKKVHEPYYELVFNYMIGDADGYTTEESIVSKDNPFIEKFVTLANSLEPYPGVWGVMLETHDLYDHAKAGGLTDNETAFLFRTMFPYYIKKEWSDSEEENEEDMEVQEIAAKLFTTKEDNAFADEFADGVRAEAEYSFLVFEGIDLYYYDEFGNRFETEFVDEKE